MATAHLPHRLPFGLTHRPGYVFPGSAGRILPIEEEERIFTVLKESRALTVVSESRTFTIEADANLTI